MCVWYTCRMFNKRTNNILSDIGIVVMSVLIAVILARTDVLVKMLTSTRELEFLGSFIAGLFFTSIFTTAPAIATLGEIAQVNSLFWTATLGAAGAVVGDLIIFRFVKDRFSPHLMDLIQHPRGLRRLRAVFKQQSFRWLTFVIGGMIIASPLPDELGVSILGFSKLRLSWFVPVSFFFNFLGIVLIGLVARSL